MKKILYTICAAAAMLAGCSKDYTEQEMPAGTHEVKISALPEWGMADEPEAQSVGTKGTATCSRYVMELYSNDTYTDRIEQETSDNGEFTLTLDRTKTYYCLLWADKDNSGETYNTADLKAVVLQPGKQPAEAFCGKLTITGKRAAYSASLNRAVARVYLKETGYLPQGTVTLKYSQQPTFSVAAGTTSGTPIEFTTTVTMTADIQGTKENPVTLNAGQPAWLLAPLEAADVVFTFQYKDTTEETAENAFEVTAPVQANYNTNIKGRFTNTPETKVGSFYYSDRTFSKIYDASKTCIGVVFWIDPKDETKGKIVSLDQPEANWNGWGNDKGRLAWSYNKSGSQNLYEQTRATDKEDGEANMATVKGFKNNDLTNYPAFAWCDAKNTPATAGISWYLPAFYEVKEQLLTQTEIVNVALRKLNAEPLPLDGWYWSSSEDSGDSRWALSAARGGSGQSSKNYNHYDVRAISTFQ